MVLKDAVRKVLARMPAGMELDPIVRFERYPSRMSYYNPNQLMELGGIFSIQFFAKEVVMLKRVPPLDEIPCRINVATFIPDINDEPQTFNGHKLPDGTSFGRYWGVELPATTQNVEDMIEEILAEKSDGQ